MILQRITVGITEVVVNTSDFEAPHTWIVWSGMVSVAISGRFLDEGSVCSSPHTWIVWSGMVLVAIGGRFPAATVTAMLCSAVRPPGSEAVTVTTASPEATAVTVTALPDAAAVATDVSDDAAA